MLIAILTHTPVWVWILLAALMYLGFSQTVSRTASLKRVTLMPVAMIALSLYGSLAVFGINLQTVLGWTGAAAVMLVVFLRKKNSGDVYYDAELRLYSLPGSWVPLVLILGIFLTKYVVGVMTSMQPALVHEQSFALLVTALYGAFSGIFLARAIRLWRLAFLPAKNSFSNSGVLHEVL